MQHGEQAGERVGGFAATKGFERVERHRDGTAEEVGLVIADRHAILQCQSAVDGGQGGAAFRLHADQNESQSMAIVAEPDVALVAIGEGVQVAIAREHRLSRQRDQHLCFARRHVPDRAQSANDFASQVRALVPERGGLPGAWRAAVDSGRARRRAVHGQQFAARVYQVVERFAREAVARHHGDAVEQERRIGAHAADRIERLVARQVAFAQGVVLQAAHQGGQALGDRFLGDGVAAVEPQRIGPAAGEPVRGRVEERISHERARNAAVRERVPVLAQVAAPGEVAQHLLDLPQHIGIVRVRAHEAQHFVQPPNLLGGAQRRTRQFAQRCQLQCGLPRREVLAAAFECGQGARRHVERIHRVGTHEFGTATMTRPWCR